MPRNMPTMRNGAGMVGSPQSAALNDALDNVKGGIKQTASALGQGAKVGLGVWGSTAQGIAKTPLRVGASLIDTGRTAMGKDPLQPFNVPGLGSVSTYARQAVDNSSNPSSIFYNKPVLSGINAASQGILDTALTGAMAKGVVNEPNGNPFYDTSRGSYRNAFGTEAKRNASGGLNLLDDTNQTFNPSQTLYRGENVGNMHGLHFTPDKSWAQNFGKNLYEGTLPPNAKVYNLQPSDMENAFQKGFTNENQMYDDIFSKGYDAIAGHDAMRSSIQDIIVNPAIRDTFKRAAGVAPLGAALQAKLSPQGNARQKSGMPSPSKYGQ